MNVLDEQIPEDQRRLLRSGVSRFATLATILDDKESKTQKLFLSCLLFAVQPSSV